MNKQKVLQLILGALLLLHSVALAEIPGAINYQGTLTDGNGNPLTGAFDITLRIYDQISSGNLVWGPELHQAVMVKNGIFSVILGQTAAFGNDTFTDNIERYVSIQVGNDVEMIPRQKITSVPYAMNGVPSGAIITWSGQTNNIPAGWELCDGQNGTPDLRDRFVLGGGGSLPSTGGMTSHAHSSPSHSHGIIADGSHMHSYSGNTSEWMSNQADVSDGSGDTVADRTHYHTYSGTTSSNGSHSHGGTTQAAGTGLTSTSSNLPPYYALAFIMKL